MGGGKGGSTSIQRQPDYETWRLSVLWRLSCSPHWSKHRRASWHDTGARLASMLAAAAMSDWRPDRQGPPSVPLHAPGKSSYAARSLLPHPHAAEKNDSFMKDGLHCSETAALRRAGNWSNRGTVFPGYVFCDPEVMDAELLKTRHRGSYRIKEYADARPSATFLPGASLSQKCDIAMPCATW